MRLVVDSNQLDSIRKDHALSSKERRNTQVVLPFWVFLELLAGRNAKSRLCSLSTFNLRFGLPPADVLDTIAELTSAQIRGFDTLMPHRCAEHRLFKRQLSNAPDALKETRREFAGHKQYGQEIQNQIGNIRGDNRSRDHHDGANNHLSFKCPMQAYEYLMEDESRPLAAMIIEGVSDKGRRAMRVGSARALLDAVKANPLLRRFHLTLATMLLGYANHWETSTLKGRVAPHGNDLTDMTLALYARDGDVILTNDRKFRDVFEFADPSKQVLVCRWDDWVRSRT
jgi:hypothetical protein